MTNNESETDPINGNSSQDMLNLRFFSWPEIEAIDIKPFISFSFVPSEKKTDDDWNSG